jgi:hypothetical protein
VLEKKIRMMDTCEMLNLVDLVVASVLANQCLFEEGWK